MTSHSAARSLKRIFVANRGEIAVRIVRAAQMLGMEVVVGFSEADRNSLPVRLADSAICIGPAEASQSYLNADQLVAAAQGVGADAIHPGYGFLAENAEFASLCRQEGLTFVGPSPEVISLMGDKIRAKEAATSAGVPTLESVNDLRSSDDARAALQRLEPPVMLKPVGGGGGGGISLVESEADLKTAYEVASAQARAAFGDPRVYMERYIGRARHIEVQVVGDSNGNVVHFGERECSLQRRHQKVVEEAPAAGIPSSIRDAILTDALCLARHVEYRNAGTVEFLLDTATNRHYFLEMNTRIQVEHPVTEMVTGVDLVQLQLREAAGLPLNVTQEELLVNGHAIEFRINAESPNGFIPSPGTVSSWSPPTYLGTRVDSHCFQGYSIPPFYDSLLAKLIVWGPDRRAAVDLGQKALEDFVALGTETTLPFLREIVSHRDFVGGTLDTGWLDRYLVTRK